MKNKIIACGFVFLFAGFTSSTTLAQRKPARQTMAQGVTIKGSTKTFQDSRKKVKRQSKLLRSKVKTLARNQKMAKKLTGISKEVSYLEKEVQKQKRMLSNVKRSGKTGKAFQLSQKIITQTKVAKLHIKAAQKAKNAKAYSNAMTNLQASLEKIDQLSGVLGLLEPIISR